MSHTRTAGREKRTTSLLFSQTNPSNVSCSVRATSRPLRSTNKDKEWLIEHLSSRGSVVIRLVEDARIGGQKHIISMDCYINSVVLFSHLYNQLGTFAMGTARQNCKHCPRDLIMCCVALPEWGLLQFKYDTQLHRSGLDEKELHQLSL